MHSGRQFPNPSRPALKRRLSPCNNSTDLQCTLWSNQKMFDLRYLLDPTEMQTRSL